MADNISITPGTGADVATDDVGGVQYQRVKLDAGGDGASTPVLAGGGVEASALRVTIANDSTGVVSVDDNGGALTVDGTVAVTNAGITTIAGAVAGTEMQVDVLTMPTVTVNSHAVTNAGTFAVQVDSCSLPTGAATAAKQLPDGHSVALSATDNAVLDAIAVDTGVIAGDTTSIDGKITACNTGAVVISSGTVTAVTSITNAVAVTNADLSTIAGDTTSLDGKVTACNTGAVVVASGSITENNSAAIKAAVEIMDDWDSNDACKVLIQSGSVSVTVNQSSAASLNCTEASAADIKTAVQIMDDWDLNDACKVTFQASTASIGQFQPSKYPTTDDPEYMNKYTFNTGAATDVIVWSPAASKRWYLTDLIISTSAAAVVTLEDDRTGGDTAVLKLDLAANGGMVCNFKTPLASGEDEADLIVTTSAGNIYITACGYEV